MSSLTIHEPGKLASDQRAVFERLKAILSGPEADKRYNAIPESRKGKLISVDVARLVSPEFQTWDAKVRHTPSTVNPAGAYAHDRLLRELSKPPANKSGTKRLVVTAGGAGSGKTSLLALTTDPVQADLIFDNQLRDFARAKQILETAAKHGWETEFWYVHRPFADTVRAVIERSQRTGRWNMLADLPRTHIEAQATIVRLRREFYETPGIKFRAQYNASAAAAGSASQPASHPKRGSRVFFRDLKEGGVYHHKDEKAMLAMIPPILAKAIKDGLICEELAAIIAPPAGPAASTAAKGKLPHAAKPKRRRGPKHLPGHLAGHLAKAAAAGVTPEEAESFPAWMEKRFERAKKSSQKLAKARGDTLKVVKGVDMKGV
ncbi:MAG: hypothetical protein HEQ23_02055 [Tepidisphaera sp.]